MRGHVVTLVARADAEEKVLSRLRAQGVHDLRTLTFRGRGAPVGAAHDLLELRRLAGSYDVVHVHRGKEHWLGAVANIGAARRLPLIRTRHIVNPVKNHAPNRWLYRTATDHVVTVSEAIRAQYLRTGLLSPARVTALPGGVDHRTFHPAVDGLPFRQAHGLRHGTKVVGVLAGFRTQKGHAVFLQAARMVLPTHPAVRFVLVGRGPDAERIRRLIADLNLGDAVLVIGDVDHPEQAVAAFDVAVYPAVASEGMGRVVFEYMAMGRPIVASAVGLVPEMLRDRDHGLLVLPGQPDALAKAIETMLDAPGFAARAGERCRALVEERYSVARIGEALEAVYRRHIDVRPPCDARP